MHGDILEQASIARLNGDNQTSIKLCREILAGAPDRMDAASMLGVNLAELGDLEGARPLIVAALQSAPNNWRYLLDHSVLLECEGDLVAARNEAEKASRAAPERYESWGRLGDLAGKLGEFSGAVSALEKALAAFPGHPALALRLAAAAFELGELDRADSALDILENAVPGHPQGLLLRTHIARQRNDWAGLIKFAEAALATSPNEEAPRVALAFGYAQTGHFIKAVEVYRPLAEQSPPKATHLATYGKYLIWSRRLDEAADYFRRALDIEPTHSDAASGLARYLNFNGDFENAALYARKALASNPNHSEAFAELALATGSDLTDEEIENLRRIGANEREGLKHRSMAMFSCGDALHHRKNRKGAFEAWDRANKLKHSIGDADPSARYDRAKHEAYVDRIIRSFPTDIAPGQWTNSETPVPIFIVGMPRSGTTLLDSAISAHSQVSSGGELPYMTFALGEFFQWANEAKWTGGNIPNEILGAFRQGYQKGYTDYGVQLAPFITDKLPSNFLTVGLIRRAFPEARIIQIRRNPVEVGFSIYRRNFTTGWPFSNSLEEIGHYYSEYARISEHWSRSLGDNIAFVQYEDFVRNFERELRRIIAFCGLEWETDCLEYYKQERRVITFSAAQVRKPPSPDHLNSTAPYDAYLEPLRRTLSERGINLETGARILN